LSLYYAAAFSRFSATSRQATLAAQAISALPNSSPPKLEDSLWVENPLAGILKGLGCLASHQLSPVPEYLPRVSSGYKKTESPLLAATESYCRGVSQNIAIKKWGRGAKVTISAYTL